jgi:hypothetical protein
MLLLLLLILLLFGGGGYWGYGRWGYGGGLGGGLGLVILMAITYLTYLALAGYAWSGVTGRDYLGGMSGTGLIPTMMSTNGVPAGNVCPPPRIPDPIAGIGWLMKVCKRPSELRLSLKARMKSRSESGPRRCIPNWNPPVTTEDALESRTLSFPKANLRSAISWPPIAAPSPSSPYDDTMARCPAKRRHTSAIWRCSSSDKLLGATIACSRIRSSRSASADDCASAAALRASAIRASAVSTSFRALAASAFRPTKTASLACRSCVSFADAKNCTASSPATPMVIKMAPNMTHTGFHSHFLASLNFSNSSGISCQYSTIKPATTKRVITDSHNSNESSEVSRLLMLRSRAEVSIERYENRRRICLLVTAFALILHFTRNMMVPLIAALVQLFRRGL